MHPPFLSGARGDLRLSSKPEVPKMSLSRNSYSVISLFSGAGGMDLGFESEGFRLLEAIDINHWCVKTLQQNRPQWKVILGDVCAYHPQLTQTPDVLVAGVPCQGFSLGGNRQEHDKRNLLYKEVIRIANLCQPRVVVIENVFNLRTMRAPDTKRLFNVVAARYAKDRLNGKFVRNSEANVTLWRVMASRIRTFTHREYARLQTFPDSWVFVDGNKRDIHLQIGNAVPVRFAEHLARNIRIALECIDKGLPFSDALSNSAIPGFVQLSLFWG